MLRKNPNTARVAHSGRIKGQCSCVWGVYKWDCDSLKNHTYAEFEPTEPSVCDKFLLTIWPYGDLGHAEDGNPHYIEIKMRKERVR